MPIVRSSGQSRITLAAAALVFFSLTLIYYLQTGLTGMAVSGIIEYSEFVNVGLTGNSTVNVTLSSVPVSVRLEGRLIGGSDFALYLLNDTSRLLIADGKSAHEVPPALDEDISGVVGLINKSSVVSDEIRTRMDYASGSRWDSDDNGREFLNSAIDFTVKNTTFTVDLDGEKLCTLWEIYSIYSGNLTTICYGASGCCRLYGLEAASGSVWDETFYLPYGKYSSKEKNVVGARVIYSDIDLSLESAAYKVYHGNWDFKKAIFYEPRFTFTKACNETCAVSNIPADLTFHVDVGEGTSMWLDKADYESVGGPINFQPSQVVNTSVYVTDETGKPIGHYGAKQENNMLRLKVSTRPMEATVFTRVTGSQPLQARWDFGWPSAPVSASEAVISGLSYSPENITAVFGPVNDSLVSSEVLAMTPGLVFKNMSVTLKRYDNVTLVSECAGFNVSSFRCVGGWSPVTTNFRDTGENITFWVDHSGVFAGVNAGIIDSLLNYSGAMVQEPAQIGSPVKWSTMIVTKYQESLRFNAVITAPLVATDIHLMDADSGKYVELSEITEAGSEMRRFHTALTGSRTYVLTYNTLAPSLVEDEVVDSEGSQVKRVSVLGAAPYDGVWAYTTTPNFPGNRIRVFEEVDGALAEITDDPAYNLTLKDVDGDGRNDWAYWRLIHPTNGAFRFIADKRQVYENASRESCRTLNVSGPSYESQMTVEPFGYMSNGSLREYDGRWLPSQYGYSAESPDYKAQYAIGPKTFLFASSGGNVISTPQETNTGVSLASGDTLAITDMWNSTDVEYSAGLRKLWVRFVVYDINFPGQFKFVLSASNLTLEDEHSGIAAYDANKTRLLGLSAPQAVDARGRRQAVTGALAKKSKDYLYTLSFDEAYLKEASYPLEVTQYWSLTSNDSASVKSTDGTSLYGGIILGGGGLGAPSRAYVDFAMPELPKHATVTDARLRFTVASPMTANCTRCMCAAYPLEEPTSYYGADATRLFEGISNKTPYGSTSCARAGVHEINIGQGGQADLQSKLQTGAFSIGLASANESSDDDSASLGARQPALIVGWTTATTTTLPYLWVDDARVIERGRRCGYDISAGEYVCAADYITLNGTVKLLRDGENRSRNIRFNAVNFTITSPAVLDASGRDIYFAENYNITEPGGGRVIVEADYITVEGNITTKGGNYSSSLHTMNAGGGGAITLKANKIIYAPGYLISDGGHLATEETEGESGGRPGAITLDAGSTIRVGWISAKAGDSNNNIGETGGKITIRAAGAIYIGETVADGGFSRYDSGGWGGKVTINSEDWAETGCINVSGGTGLLGAGGRGGEITVESPVIIVNCRQGGNSGGSDRAINEPGGKVAYKAYGGLLEVLAPVDVSGGHDARDGVGGTGGTISVQAASVVVNATLQAAGGNSRQGTGGAGGNISVEYCSALSMEPGMYDVLGGEGLEFGANGTMSTSSDMWCTIPQENTTAETTSTTSTTSTTLPGPMPQEPLTSLLESNQLLLTDVAGQPPVAQTSQTLQIRAPDGKRLVQFDSTPSPDLSTIKVASKDGRFVFDFATALGVEPTHSIFIRNTRSAGVYICPKAKLPDETGYGCDGMIVFTHSECVKSTEKESVTCVIDGTDYMIKNIMG